MSNLSGLEKTKLLPLFELFLTGVPIYFKILSYSETNGRQCV